MKRILSILFTVVCGLACLQAQTVGLVLSGGGAKGIAHIGIIKALEENNVPIDYVAGTSMGAIVGAWYAMGYTPDEMLDLILSEDFNLWSRGIFDKRYVYYFKKPDPTPEIVTFNVALQDSTKFEPHFLPNSLINPFPMNYAFMSIFAPYLRIYFLIMSCILNIETSTDVCSVAISDSGQVIFNQEDHTGPNHAVKLGVFVDEALDFLDSHGLPLEAVAVSCGPGSYTGLRIGVSMAKGICYGRGVKLIAVPTLELMAVPVLLGEHPEEEDALIVPMLDARRMEVYAEVLDRALKVVRPIQADIVDADTYKEYLDQHHVYFFGNGAAKCMETINHPNAHLVEGIEPLAKNMAPLAEKRFVEGKFEDVAYFVPFYLKDFVAKMPKKLL